MVVAAVVQLFSVMYRLKSCMRISGPHEAAIAQSAAAAACGRRMMAAEPAQPSQGTDRRRNRTMMVRIVLIYDQCRH